MKDYIGTKRLSAGPMTRGEYNAYRGWTIPPNEDPNEAGYLVEYCDGGKANDSRHVGYISWSPADVFERSYREDATGAAPNPDEVICPHCCHQFRAIPVQVQQLLLGAGIEPPFTEPPKAAA